MKNTCKRIFFFSFLLVLSEAGSAQKFSRLKKIDYVGVKTDTGRSVSVTFYNYSGNRSGDLKSALIKFDNSTSMRREFDYSPLDSVQYEEQSFDPVDKRLSKISKIKSAGRTSWIQETKEEYLLNSTGDVSTVKRYVRIPPATAWDDAYKTEFTYIAPGKVDTATSYEWISGAWLPSEQTVYSYSPAYDILSILFKRGRSLTNLTLRNMVYIAPGKIESEEGLNWNSTAKTWDKSDMKRYYYDAAAKVDSVLYLRPSPGGYTKVQRNVYSKDDSGNVIKRELQAWYEVDHSYLTFNLFYIDFDKKNNPVTEIFLNLVSSKLDTVNRRTMTYNGYNQILSNTNEAYKAGIWATGYGEDKIRYEYEEFELSFKEQKWANGSLSLFPVPSNDRLEILFNQVDPQGFTVLIYDITGKVWDHWDVRAVKDYHDAISVRQFPAGHYFMKINSNTGHSIVGKFAVSH